MNKFMLIVLGVLFVTSTGCKHESELPATQATLVVSLVDSDDINTGYRAVLQIHNQIELVNRQSWDGFRDEMLEQIQRMRKNNSDTVITRILLLTPPNAATAVELRMKEFLSRTKIHLVHQNDCLSFTAKDFEALTVLH